MLLNINVRRTWIPPLLDNERKTADEQIIIEYDKPTATDRSAWQHQVAKRDKGTVVTYLDTDIRAILRGSNVLIHHLRIKTGGKVGSEGKVVDEIVNVTSGEQLSEIRSDYCWLLATQTANKIMELEVSEELVKNSAPDSGPAS